MRDDRRSALWLAGILGALIALCASGCGWTSGSGTRSLQFDAYPHESLDDWVSYGDAAVTFRATHVVEVPPSNDEAASGEGVVLRKVTAKVTGVAWSALPEGDVPTEMSFVTSGWAFDADGRHAVSAGGIRLEVGKEYLAPVGPSLQGTWAPIHLEEIMTWSDGRASAGAGPTERSERAVHRLDGMGIHRIGSILAAAKPDPMATADRSLPPEQRLAAVEGLSPEN